MILPRQDLEDKDGRNWGLKMTGSGGKGQKIQEQL